VCVNPIAKKEVAAKKATKRLLSRALPGSLLTFFIFSPLEPHGHTRIHTAKRRYAVSLIVPC